jgi:2-polyprenyl-3-methyl-5-hydroxy-6-metoxy-1,4-benzoquinol methylase
MSDNSPSTNVDVTQLVHNIREQIRRRSEQSNQGAQVATGTSTASIPAQLRASLRSISDEINALSLQIEKGEPETQSVTLRGRIGYLIKSQLYRLLWWHSYQLKTLVALMARRSQEELKIVQTLSPPSEQIQEIRRQVQESEQRLRQLESAQLRLQAAEVERNVRASAAQAEEASLRQELTEVKSALKESGTQSIKELAQRLEAESAQREEMAIRLSELGLLTHQTRASLTIHDRRLALFIQEARKRLPQPFTDDQLQQIVKQHTAHRYESLYAAFEDVFRGTREEIKAKQSVYLPLLREHGIGSSNMPILDLGCGRGEWLELLREAGLQARGIDCNEIVIEYCKSAGLDVVHGDALSCLRALPDASLGALTSFHMIEHLPFDVILTLIDEALRALKTGGILILETPNPQNILVGSHTFYLDPTHLKPLPSAMVRFFVEARGFCNVQVRELNPYPASVRFADDGKGLANRLNDYLYGAQDYAVIGQKP